MIRKSANHANHMIRMIRKSANHANHMISMIRKFDSHVIRTNANHMRITFQILKKKSYKISQISHILMPNELV